jgi:hypothetical protein
MIKDVIIRFTLYVARVSQISAMLLRERGKHMLSAVVWLRPAGAWASVLRLSKLR